MRRNGEEWSFDAAKELAKCEEPHIAYVALYSDVEHEVSTVTSGYRVTVTYNLYFDDKIKPDEVSAPTSLSPLSPGVTDFRNKLEALLLNPTFLPDGGLLGFNLEHHYPVQNNSSAYVDLGHVEQCLKGVDAEIMTIAKGLSLHASVRGLITLNSKNGTLLVTEGSIPDFNEVGFSSEGEGVAAYLVWQGAKVVRVSKEWSEEERRHMYVNWITRPSRLNRKRKIYPYYGNGLAETRYTYNSFCLFVEVGVPGQRSLRPDLKGDLESDDEKSSDGYGKVVVFTDSQD